MEEITKNDEQKKCCRHKWPIMVLAILVIGAIVIISLVRDRIVNKQYWQVNVVGVGKVTVKPDLAILNLGVKTVNELVAKTALDKNTKAINEVIKKLTDKGLKSDDIQTSFYNLSPVYNSNGTEVIGYTAEQQLTVKVRDIQNQGEKKIGEIIELASSAGVNQVYGINYDYLEIDSIKQQVRIMAINDAQKKAVELSQQTGVKLGKIVGWWENYITNPIGASGSIDYGSGGGASPIILPGVSEITIEMNVSYLVK